MNRINFRREIMGSWSKDIKLEKEKRRILKEKKANNKKVLYYSIYY